MPLLALPRPGGRALHAGMRTVMAQCRALLGRVRVHRDRARPIAPSHLTNHQPPCTAAATVTVGTAAAEDG